MAACGLWSLAFNAWAHSWYARTGKWLYPFLDVSKPYAPAATLGLYLMHFLAFGVLALMYRLKRALLAAGGAGAVAAEVGKAKAKAE